GSEVGAVVRRSVTQILDAEPLHELEVLPPMLVMAGLGEAVYPLASAVGELDEGIAAFDSRRKQEARETRGFTAHAGANSARCVPRSSTPVGDSPRATQLA